MMHRSAARKRAADLSDTRPAMKPTLDWVVSPMLDRIPMFVAKWILAIPAVVALTAGMIVCSMMQGAVGGGETDPQVSYVLGMIALACHLVVVGAFTLLQVYARPAQPIAGYSKGFWMALLLAGYCCGIGLGIVAGPM